MSDKQLYVFGESTIENERGSVTYKPCGGLCPECSSIDIHLTWIDASDNSVGIDTQLGECNRCGHDWNECARNRYG